MLLKCSLIHQEEDGSVKSSDAITSVTGVLGALRVTVIFLRDEQVLPQISPAIKSPPADLIPPAWYDHNET